MKLTHDEKMTSLTCSREDERKCGRKVSNARREPTPRTATKHQQQQTDSTKSASNNQTKIGKELKIKN